MYGGSTEVPGTFEHAQTGQASWYDPPWSGLTAAHPSLPFGTHVTVTDLATGRTVIVVINDRGPFGAGRVIDLSPEAFQALRPLGAGILDVAAQLVEVGAPGDGGSPGGLGAGAIRELAARHGIRPTKSLGQNFLIDPNLARAIAADAEVGPGDRVVEIGAGLGSLTIALAATGARVRRDRVRPPVAARARGGDGSLGRRRDRPRRRDEGGLGRGAGERHLDPLCQSPVQRRGAAGTRRSSSGRRR